ncbi:hypothetical protein C9993_01425 [Marinobacter sp. Z-F4-2]|nr:hypothetical protein C9993_01425 [Marinobacter sp. Z-F4-2]
MNLYADVKRRTYEEVAELLSKNGHESVLEHIEDDGGRYRLKAPVQKISPLPTYRFALACTLVALGNFEQAESIVSQPHRFIEPGWGDEISRDLARAFCDD